MLQSLCVPCACRCRYCLLSWDGRLPGADWERSRDYAARFAAWIKTERPEIAFHLSFGYSMEHPRLPQVLDFLRKIGSVSAKYLQCDGLRMREEEETGAFVSMLKERGIEHLNFTYYGIEAYHDRFASRRGDFQWLRRLHRAAQDAGLQTSAGIPLYQDNVSQVDELLAELGEKNTRLFIPHAEGRGAALERIRLRIRDFSRMSEEAQGRLNRAIYRSEAEWLAAPPPQPEQRSLLLSLTPENIAWFESEDYASVIAWAERLDEAYYSLLPPQEELLCLYGDPEGESLFSARDLLARCQKQFFAEHKLQPYDVTDERQSGSRRF